MRLLRIGTFQWATGIFCAVVGALMLVAPHQFDSPSFVWLRIALPWWGAMFLGAGTSMISVVAVGLRGWAAFVAHLLVAGAFLLLTIGFAMVGGLTGIVVYSMLGIGALVAAVLDRKPMLPPEAKHADLFVLAMALGGLGNGLLMLLVPGQFTSWQYDSVRSYLAWLGGAFLLSGACVLATELRPPASRVLHTSAYLALAAVFEVFCVWVPLQNRTWTGIAFYGGFGILLACFPWSVPSLRRVDRASLQMRLAMLFAAAAAFPLILLSIVNNAQQDTRAQNEARIYQQSLNRVDAQTVDSFVQSHTAALQTLALDPNLSNAPLATQQAQLRTVQTFYDAFDTLALWNADGTLRVASATQTPNVSLAATSLYGTLRATNAPTVTLELLPNASQAALVVGIPLRDTSGQFGGMLTASLHQDALSKLLTTLSDTQLNAYVVAPMNQLIGSSLAANSTKLEASSAAFAPLLASGVQSGVSDISIADTPYIVSFSRLSALPATLVLTQPANNLVLKEQQQHDVTFGLLLLTIAIAATLGSSAARGLVLPLRVLGRAAIQFAHGDTNAPLPTTRVTETAQLANAFSTMRAQLSQRTSERDKAEARLRLLADASSELAASLNLDQTLDRLAALMVPAFGELCTIDLLEEAHTLHRVVTAPTLSQEASEALLHAFSEGGLERVMQTGQTRVRTVEHMSSISLPLRERDRVIGAISVLARARYTEEDVVLVEEIVQRAATAIENAQLYQLAQQAIRHRDEFLSVAAHELRTPITSVLGYSELLLRRTTKDDTLNTRDRRTLLTIRNQTERLNRLIGGLLDVARIEMGSFTIQQEPIDLTDLVHRVVIELAATTERHAFHLHATEALTIMGDDLRLHQVVQNLVSNAVKYSPDGGPIDITIDQDGTHAWLRITDYGIGIPIEAQTHLFERFFRVRDSATQHIIGMGIGLSVVQEIVALHGGTVSVESTPGVGSTFTVCLPGLLASSPVSPEQIGNLV